MKWLRLLVASILMFTFVSACAATNATAPTAYVNIPQMEFASISVPSAAPTATATAPTRTPVRHTPVPVAPSKAVTTGTPSVLLTGEASWGYGFKGNVVTRYPRGTRIRVCGPIGCTGVVKSWGYGPAKYTGRIADLDVNIFENVCGPRSMGVCQIRLEVFK